MHLTGRSNSKNYGLVTQTFNVNVTIIGDVFGEVYNQTVSVTDLAPDASQAVVFPPFTEPQVDNYTINAATLLQADENISNNSMSKKTYVSTIIMHTWDDDEADGDMTPYPFDNTMLAVKYTPFATDFTILGGYVYVNNYNPNDDYYAEFEWVKICPDDAGAPDLDNAYGTLDNVGTHTVPVLIPIDIPDVVVTDYTGDIWIVVKYLDAEEPDSWLCMAIDTDGPDGYSYINQYDSPPVWNQVTDRDYMMRIEVQYEPCVPAVGYEYVPGDASMGNGAWPPVIDIGDILYLVANLESNYALSPTCNLDGFYASADATGNCVIDIGDILRIVDDLGGGMQITWCGDEPGDPMSYPSAWSEGLPPEPAGWPNCDPPVLNIKVIPTDSSK